MTTLTMLSGDWEIAFDDETVGSNAVAGMRMIRRTSGASETVYTSNALYSAVADEQDAFQAMGFQKAMSPVTPNAYTVDNKYFIPRRDTQYLREGTLNNDLAVTSGDGVYRKVYGAVTAAPVDGDIGRQVTEATSGDTGTLLDFETEPDGTTVLWIRPDTSGDTFALSTALTCTGDGGTCNVTGSGAATSGENQYTAFQVIGSVPTATDVYIYQDRYKMTDYLGGFQWWTTDPSVSLGIVSTLVRTQVAGTTIADGDLEVFARRYTSLYDNFRLNVAAGGFPALPLASAPDINNTTGYARVTTDAGSLVPAVGDVLRQDGAGNENNKLVITAISGTGPNYTIDFYHTGDQTGFADNDVIEDLAESATLTLSSNETATPGGPTETGAGNGGTVTITLGTTTRDHDGDSTAEPYSVIIDAQSDVPIAKVYERIKYVTRRGADETVLFGAGTNVPGESYRGLDALFEYDANTGTMTQGDDIDVGGDWTARLMAQNTTNSPTYITVTDQQTSLDSVSDNDVIDDESGDNVTVHAGGSLGIQAIASVKASPFGTFTGSQIFGARGIDFRNPAPADTQAYILTDDLGTLRNPPNTVSFIVNNTAAGDRVYVARDTGTAGEIDKDQFGGIETPSGSYNGVGDSVIRVAGSIDSEVPDAGYVRIIENTLQQEHRYVYTSRTTGSNGEFTLTAIPGGTATAGTSPTQLSDSGGDFVNDGVEPGMLVRDTTNSDNYEVVSVDSATQLTLIQVFGTGGTFASGDSYTINDLIQNYATSDDLHDLILDFEATGSTTSNSFVKTLAADFDVVVNVRQGKTILPFTQNATVGDSGASVTVVRTADTIAT